MVYFIKFEMKNSIGQVTNDSFIIDCDEIKNNNEMETIVELNVHSNQGHPFYDSQPVTYVVTDIKKV